MGQLNEQLQHMATMILDNKVSSIRTAAEKLAEEEGISKKSAKARTEFIGQLVNAFMQTSELKPDELRWRLVEAKIHLAEKRGKALQKRGTATQRLDQLQEALDTRIDKQCWPYIQLSSLLLRALRSHWKKIENGEAILWKEILEQRADSLEEILTRKGPKSFDDDRFLKLMAHKVENEGKSIHKAAVEVLAEKKDIWKNQRGHVDEQSLKAMWMRKFRSKFPKLAQRKKYPSTPSET